MSITRCKYCNKPLALNEYAFSSREGMYCQLSCAIVDAMSLYTEDEYEDQQDLVDAATAYVQDITEMISREDYGVEEKIRPVYVESEDITFMFKDVVEGDTTVSTELIGFHYGNHEEDSTYGLKAEFVM